MHANVVRLSMDQISDLARRALAGSGAEGVQLEQAADSIVAAEADGIRSVGLGYLPTYCEHLRCGKISGRAIPSHARSAGAALVSHAGNGFAHAAFAESMEDFHALTRKQGIAALSIVNSYSAGVLGWFVERSARAGLVGIGFANSSAVMAPYGGSRAFFGTNPLAFAVPRGGGRPPLIADMATSQVAYVTVRDHAERGEEIPVGWGLDSLGEPTTDPDAVLDGGSMAPVGGYKGMLLALLVDILAGGLAGPNFAYQAAPFGDNTGGPPDVGQMFLALAPAAFAAAGEFTPRMEAMLAALTADAGARIPGDSRHAHRTRAAREGVEVPEALIDQLESYA